MQETFVNFSIKQCNFNNFLGSENCAYSEVPNKNVTFFILFGDFFLITYMALLGPTRLFIFGKSCHLHGFLLSKYWKIPTYMPLLGPTRLLISEKTSYLHCY